MDADGREAASIAEAGTQLRGDLERLRRVVLRKSSELLDGSRKFVEEHPLGALGVAFGAGYVISGGLYSRTTGRLLQLGSRVLLASIVRQLGWVVALGQMGIFVTPRAEK